MPILSEDHWQNYMSLSLNMTLHNNVVPFTIFRKDGSYWKLLLISIMKFFLDILALVALD